VALFYVDLINHSCKTLSCTWNWRIQD